MKLEVQHVEVHASSLTRAKEFYVNKLGLDLIEEIPGLNLIALRAGKVRISIFGGFEKKPDIHREKYCGTHLIFRTNNLEKTVNDLKKKGVVFTTEIIVAGDFMRDVATMDPDGNIIEFAEYLREPL